MLPVSFRQRPPVVHGYCGSNCSEDGDGVRMVRVKVGEDDVSVMSGGGVRESISQSVSEPASQSVSQSVSQ